jgi:hypothetical protein
MTIPTDNVVKKRSVSQLTKTNATAVTDSAQQRSVHLLWNFAKYFPGFINSYLKITGTTERDCQLPSPGLQECLQPYEHKRL